MKVRVKQRAKRFSSLSCRCCTRIHFKEEAIDKQVLKEALEEINGEAVVTG